MEIHHGYRDLPAAARGTVAAIGNFDGVHCGHAAVIGCAAALAARLDRPLAAVTFEPHPIAYFKPDSAAFRLTPPAAKARRLAELGLDRLFVLPFDADLAGQSAEAFCRDVLAGGLGLVHVVAGSDFVFGHKRGGDVGLLARTGAAAGFGTTALAEVAERGGRRYSSSAIRRALAAGDVADAARLLGRPWEVEGPVVAGDQRGREWGFPTANLALGEEVRPAYGVYAVRLGVVAAGGRATWYDGVASFGRRATVDGERELLETYVFDFDGDLYGETVRVAFVAAIRLGDTQFSSVEALRKRIERDCREARDILAQQAP